jgi:hypothetical protein
VRTIAVDWSGRASSAGNAIWLAEADESGVIRLEGGRDREELVDHLIEVAHQDRELIVGLDFAFSFPEWFVRKQGVADAVAFWNVVENKGEKWLTDCKPPFWRKQGSGIGATKALRVTERANRIAGNSPTSVFKLVGPSQVGPGSIRGIPHLVRLRQTFAVWPFDAAKAPSVIEIWPRIFAAGVVKGLRRARIAFLAKHAPEIKEPLRGVAASNDDVFDAAVSAVQMWRYRHEILAMPSLPEYALEGCIWTPDPEIGTRD